MHPFADFAKALSRSTVYLSGLQSLRRCGLRMQNGWHVLLDERRKHQPLKTGVPRCKALELGHYNGRCQDAPVKDRQQVLLCDETEIEPHPGVGEDRHRLRRALTVARSSASLSSS